MSEPTGLDQAPVAPRAWALNGLGEQAKRWYMRIGYTYIKPNNKNGDLKDESGPVLAYRSVKDLAQQGLLLDQNGQPCGYNSAGSGGSGSLTNPSPANGSYCNQWGVIATQLDAAMIGDGVSGLGVPPGVSGTAGGMGMPTIQVGAFLDDAEHWAAEAFVLAVPPTASLTVTGVQALQGQVGLTTKVLPATVILNHYFGDKRNRWRPSLGIGGAYAMFFDAKANAVINEYAGGQTTVTVNNAFGYGPFVGLQYQADAGWHFSAQLGYMKLRTTATLITSQTHLNAQSSVVRGYPEGSQVAGAINAILGIPGDPDNPGLPNGADKVTTLLQSVEATQSDKSLGTYTRTLKAQLDPYILSLNIGYRF